MVQSQIPREISQDRSKSKSSANTLTRKVIVSIPPPQRHSLRPRNQCGSASSGLPASPPTLASGAGEEERGGMEVSEAWVWGSQREKGDIRGSLLSELSL